MTVTENITKLARSNAPTVAQLVENKEYIDYGTYAKITDLLYWE